MAQTGHGALTEPIAAALGTVDGAIAAEEDRKVALQALFQSLLHNLMTGTVRVPHS